MHVKKKKVGPEEKAARKEEKAVKKSKKIKKSRVESTIEKHRQEVAKYIKVTTRFERQKLARRQNEQRKDPEKLAKVNEEIAACNALDPEALAKRHMRRTFSKIRSVHESPELPEPWRATVQDDPLEAALANVSARLYSHKLVKMAMNKCVNNVRMAIAQQTAEKVGDHDKSDSHGALKLSKLEDDVRATPDLPDRTPKNNTVSRAKTEQDFSDDDILNVYGDEDHDSASRKHSSKIQSKKRTMSEISDSLESTFESALDSSESQSESEDDQPQPKRVKTKSLAAAPTNSTFVPSLTAVGYAVNSDSEASDLDEEVAPRKNRRGQKARQAIWEKKYKEKAKHLQKQQQQQQKPKGKHKPDNGGWDPRRGAVSTGANFEPVTAQQTRTTVVENGTTVHVVGDQRIKEKSTSLHPSWEAKKQMKAKEKTIDQYAGKKITF